MSDTDPHPWLSEVEAGTTPELDDVIDAHPDLIRELRKQDPIASASVFASLLGCTALQSNCVRLETLIHLCLIFGKGTDIPKASQVQSWFKTLENGPCGPLEDGAEDVFVASVSTGFGNARVLEGVWECGGYYVQRLLDSIFTYEKPKQLSHFAKSILALLSLSDAFCDRSELQRWQLGEKRPQHKIPGKIIGRVRKLAKRARFSHADLKALGIDREDLSPFTFGPHQIEALKSQAISHTDLERYPIIITEDETILALPTAISAAIRRFAFEFLDAALGEGWLAASLADHYERHFETMPWLGEHIPGKVEFQKPRGRRVLSAAIGVDAGRYLNPIFIMDDLVGFEQTGFPGWSPNIDQDGAVIAEGIELAYQDVSARPDFQSMITVIVCCGLGRVTKTIIPGEPLDNHRIISMSAADFALLSQSGQFKALTLWRLLESEASLADQGIELLNVNGFLNMLAWSERFNGNLVPQPFFRASGASENLLVMVEHNAIRDLRGKLSSSLDLHRVQAIDGTWTRVMRTGTSLFDQDNRQPVFHSVHPDDARSYLQVFETPNRAWWSAVTTFGTGEVPHEWLFGWYEVFKTWLPKLVPVLEQHFNDLPTPAMRIALEFDADANYASEDKSALSFEQALAHLNARHDGPDITIQVIPGFERAIGAPTNIAERALIQKVIQQVAKLSHQRLSEADLARLMNAIIKDPLARQSHRFLSDDFRDRIKSVTGDRVIHVDPIDAGTAQVGLGWRVRAKEEGNRLEGAANCRDFLRALETSLLAELKGHLTSLDRTAMIRLLMLNHERAAVDRSRWQRTAAAVQALHDQDPSVRNTIVQQHFDLNGVFQASRILIEIAVCEAPLKGGRPPGQLDVSRLMTLTQMAMHFSGCADAIHFGAMSPEVEILPVGGVELNYDFHQSIFIPHASQLTNALIDTGIEKHAREYAGLPGASDEEAFLPQVSDGAFEPQFLSAFEAEYGVTLDEARIIVDYLEDLALIEGTPILCKRLSELVSIDTAGGTVAPEQARRLIERWTLPPRSCWEAEECGVVKADLRIGQFRRRFGMLSRPLVRIDHEHDPNYLLSPGMVREAFAYQFRHMHQGDYRARFYTSDEMRAWKAVQDGLRGEKFEADVEKALLEAGWQAKRNITLNEILGQKLDRDFGDIDVLAWNQDQETIYVLECKDIAFRQAPGELAEQLKRFQGAQDERGKRDLLCKHLDRVERLLKSSEFVRDYCRLPAAKIKHAIVFKNPVPMSYAEARISQQTDVIVFDRLLSHLNDAAD